jgi:hypothetical protein
MTLQYDLYNKDLFIKYNNLYHLMDLFFYINDKKIEKQNA